MDFYPVDSAIQPLNNQGQTSKRWARVPVPFGPTLGVLKKPENECAAFVSNPFSQHFYWYDVKEFSKIQLVVYYQCCVLNG